jgi:hypothetical protein
VPRLTSIFAILGDSLILYLKSQIAVYGLEDILDFKIVLSYDPFSVGGYKI